MASGEHPTVSGKGAGKGPGKGGNGLGKGPADYCTAPAKDGAETAAAELALPPTVWSNVSNATEWAMVFDREIRRSGAIVDSRTGNPMFIPGVLSLVLEYVSPGFHEVMTQCPKWVLARSLNAIPQKIHRFGFKWRYITADAEKKAQPLAPTTGTVAANAATAAPKLIDPPRQLPTSIPLAVRTTAEFMKELSGELSLRREWCFHARRRMRQLNDGYGFTPPSFTRTFLPKSPFGDPTEGDADSDDEATAARAKIPRNRERDVVAALCELIDSEAPGVVRVVTSTEALFFVDPSAAVYNSETRTKTFRIWIGPNLEIPTGAALTAATAALVAAAEAAEAASAAAKAKEFADAKAAAAAAEAAGTPLSWWNLPRAPSDERRPPFVPPVLTRLPPATSDGRLQRPVLELEFTRTAQHREWSCGNYEPSDDYREETSAAALPSDVNGPEMCNAVPAEVGLHFTNDDKR